MSMRLLMAAMSSPAVALDMSPAENSLLELKLAAIQHLNHEEFLQLLGVTPSTDRYHCYEGECPTNLHLQLE